mmetsp:Transcript_86898/g.281408  ORF Transcript_86898/g.281408 Transcript_86898/m.281408 type:complete len:220 (-) Transcript_86898:898-1557(-)
MDFLKDFSCTVAPLVLAHARPCVILLRIKRQWQGSCTSKRTGASGFPQQPTQARAHHEPLLIRGCQPVDVLDKVLVVRDSLERFGPHHVAREQVLCREHLLWQPCMPHVHDAWGSVGNVVVEKHLVGAVWCTGIHHHQLPASQLFGVGTHSLLAPEGEVVTQSQGSRPPSARMQGTADGLKATRHHLDAGASTALLVKVQAVFQLGLSQRAKDQRIPIA